MRVALVDVAAFREEPTYIHFIDGPSVFTDKISGADHLRVVNWIRERVMSLRPDTVLLDTAGVGGSMFDLLRAPLNEESINLVGITR